jgi:ketosteroid isomerase-like protein
MQILDIRNCTRRLARIIPISISLSLLLVLLASLSFLFAQQGSSGDEARVLALEALWNQAELKKDAKALEQILDEAFVYVDVDGALKTKPQFLAQVLHPSDDIGAIGNESMFAHVYGNTVVVSGVFTEKGTTKGKHYSRRSRFTDTWIKRDLRWLCVASQSTLIQGK